MHARDGLGLFGAATDEDAADEAQLTPEGRDDGGGLGLVGTLRGFRLAVVLRQTEPRHVLLVSHRLLVLLLHAPERRYSVQFD